MFLPLNFDSFDSLARTMDERQLKGIFVTCPLGCHRSFYLIEGGVAIASVQNLTGPDLVALWRRGLMLMTPALANVVFESLRADAARLAVEELLMSHSSAVQVASRGLVWDALELLLRSFNSSSAETGNAPVSPGSGASRESSGESGESAAGSEGAHIVDGSKSAEKASSS